MQNSELKALLFFPVLQDHINVNDLRMRTMTGRNVFSFGKEEDTQREAFSSCSNFDTFPLKSSCKITLSFYLSFLFLTQTYMHDSSTSAISLSMIKKENKSQKSADPILFVEYKKVCIDVLIIY